MLSNLGWLWNSQQPESSAPVEVRPARANELRSAVRLIVSSSGGHPNERIINEYLQLAQSHSDLGGLWVVEQGGTLFSALLPIISPGRTMLIFPPAHLPTPYHEQATRLLIETVCHQAHSQGIHLVQILLDDDSSRIYPLLLSCSFKRLAELLYLQTSIPRGLASPPLPADCRWLTYSSDTHHRFAEAILATYQQSLDCPALNGLRHIDDILAGHKATGQFNPNLWFLLCQKQDPLGVLLLSPVPRSDVVELVYLGLSPQHRGRGTGDLLMRQAAHVVSASSHGRLSLAVDAANLPALRLYWRHGLQAIARKLALLRDLRIPSVTFGPAVEQWKQRFQHVAPAVDPRPQP